MDTVTLIPFTTDTALTGYMPLPRELPEMGLPSTAVLLYAALLDRGTLSQKNSYADSSGQVYVIYPVEHLAETFQISTTAVKRHLRELEAKGLIRRCREVRNGANHIYLCLPTGSCGETNRTPGGTKMPPPRGRKVPPNNRRKQQEQNNNYQHGEDESL